MKQVIQLYENKSRTVWRPSGGKVFRPAGRTARLQRVLWKLLVRLGAIWEHMDETVEVTRVLIDEPAVFNRVRAVLDAIHSRDERPQEVLMGPGTFAELMSAPEVRNYSSPFSFEVNYRVGGHRGSLFGLPVRVLPWMEGVLVR